MCMEVGVISVSYGCVSRALTGTLSSDSLYIYNVDDVYIIIYIISHQYSLFPTYFIQNIKQGLISYIY